MLSLISKHSAEQSVHFNMQTHGRLSPYKSSDLIKLSFIVCRLQHLCVALSTSFAVLLLKFLSHPDRLDLQPVDVIIDQDDDIDEDAGGAVVINMGGPGAEDGIIQQGMHLLM